MINGRDVIRKVVAEEEILHSAEGGEKMGGRADQGRHVNQI